jgi:hypothetical protein
VHPAVVDLEALRALAAGVAVDRALEVVAGPPGCGWSIQTHTGRIQVDPVDLATLPADQLHGLTCHEAAHAALTRYPWLIPSPIFGRPGLKMLLNALEDCRIEDWLIERLPGSQAWIEAYNDRLFPDGSEAIARQPLFAQFGLAAIHQWWHGELPPGLDPRVLAALDATEDARRAAIAARPPAHPDTPRTDRYAQSRVSRVFVRHDGLGAVDGFEQEVRLAAAQSWAAIWTGVLPFYQPLVDATPAHQVSQAEARWLVRFGAWAPGVRLGRAIRPVPGGRIELPPVDESARDAALAPPPKDDWDTARRDVLPLVDALVQELLRVLRPRSLPRWIPDHPTGQRLDLRAAMRHEARPDPDRLWQRKTVPERSDPRFLLLLDLSGSMAGDPIHWGFRGTVLLAEVLERLRLPYAVHGFQDVIVPFKAFERELEHSRGVLSSMPAEVSGARQGGRNRPQHNWDGPVLESACDLLLERPSRSPVLIVVSDGLPSGPGDAEAALHRAVAAVGARVNLIGVGLGPGTEHVRRFYPHAVADVPLEGFPAAIGRCIQGVLGGR